MKDIKGLKADFGNGEGAVKLPDDFLDEDPLLRADILRDWLYFLEIEYGKAKGEMLIRRAARKVLE